MQKKFSQSVPPKRKRGRSRRDVSDRRDARGAPAGAPAGARRGAFEAEEAGEFREWGQERRRGCRAGPVRLDMKGPFLFRSAIEPWNRVWDRTTSRRAGACCWRKSRGRASRMAGSRARRLPRLRPAIRGKVVGLRAVDSRSWSLGRGRPFPFPGSGALVGRRLVWE